MEKVSEIKFERLSNTEMKDVKGGWRFWGKEKRLIGYGDNAYFETHQYILGNDVWTSNKHD